MSHHWGNWGNNIPVAGVKADSVVCVSKQVTFDGSDSYDPDGVITEWRWDPGDGTGYLYGMMVAHTYANGGNYTVTLRVTDNNGAISTATTVVSVKDGWVFGKAHFPDSDETPLKGLKITVTMYYEQGGDVKFLHTYPAVYSSSSGYYEVDVSSNPFSIFSFDYWEYLWYGGWNRAAITAEACNGQQVCLSGLVHNVCTYAKIAMHPHHTHKLIFKDSATGEYLSGVKATYYDGFENHSTLESGGGSSVQWSDANPLLITHVITKDGYRIRTPIIDHSRINVRSECYKETEVLMDKIVTAAFISFDKSRYYPEDVMEISYDSMSVPNCKVKLYDAGHNLVMINLRNGYTNSPPTVNYSLPTTLGYGQWLAVLEDADGNELAHTAASVGSQGDLSYDTSTRCKDKKIKISWQGIDPVFKVGTRPNNMKIELYDGANRLLGTYTVQAASGTTTYTLSDTEDLSAKWKAKLIDQWNNLVDISSISVFSCSQVIIGKVRRVNGSPVRNCKVTIDLSFMGFGVFQVTTDATGGFKFTGLPPFPATYIKSYKPGYKKLINEVSLAEDELKLLNLVIEGLVKGTVTDEENNPVANTYVILEGDGTGDVVETTQDNGNFDLPPKITGQQKLRFMKNNFNVEEKSVNVEEISENALQIVKDKQLKRRSPDLFEANFKRMNVAYETSLVQLDEIDIDNIHAGIIELTNSAQKIALIEVTAGAGNSQNTGAGTGDGTGDTICEYYGDDENGKAIWKCTYKDSLSLPAGPTVIIKDQQPTLDLTDIWTNKIPDRHLKLGQVIALNSSIKTINGIAIWNKTPSVQGIFDGHAFFNIYLMDGRDPNTANKVLVKSGISMNYQPYPPEDRGAEYTRTDFSDVLKDKHTHLYVELYYVPNNSTATLWDISFQGIYKYFYESVDDQLWWKDDTTGSKYFRFTENVPPEAGRCFIFRLYGQES